MAERTANTHPDGANTAQHQLLDALTAHDGRLIDIQLARETGRPRDATPGTALAHRLDCREAWAARQSAAHSTHTVGAAPIADTGDVVHPAAEEDEPVYVVAPRSEWPTSTTRLIDRLVAGRPMTHADHRDLIAASRASGARLLAASRARSAGAAPVSTRTGR